MQYKVPVGISNHHIHLTKETYQKLFEKPLEKDRDVNQKNEFASKQFVTLVGPKGKIEKVRVMGPFRKYNQVEISSSDAFHLGINPPVSKSGHLDEAEKITVVGPRGSVEINNACILAESHIHMGIADLEKYGVKEDDIVKVFINGKRKGILYAHIKSGNDFTLELHIDRDEANAFLLKNGDELFFEPCCKEDEHEMENWAN